MCKYLSHVLLEGEEEEWEREDGQEWEETEEEKRKKTYVIKMSFCNLLSLWGWFVSAQGQICPHLVMLLYKLKLTEAFCYKTILGQCGFCCIYIKSPPPPASFPIMPAFISLERPLAFGITEVMLYIVSASCFIRSEGVLKGKRISIMVAKQFDSLMHQPMSDLDPIVAALVSKWNFAFRCILSPFPLR